MNLPSPWRARGDRVRLARVPRSFLASLVACLVIVGCGSGGGIGASQSAAPTSAPPTVAASTAPPSETPTPSPTATPAGGTGTIALAGLSPEIDKPALTIDTSTFTTTFVSETPAIYVLYKLSTGAADKVVSTWTKDDVVINTFSLDYPANAPWAYFELSFKGGFIPGDYEEKLTLVDSGDTLTLPFTVTGPRRAPASPTPVPSGTTAFTLLSMATFADPSQSAPDTTKFTDTYAPNDPKVYVVFALRPGLTGQVICTMTANGEEAIDPITLTYGSQNSWGSFEISSGGLFPEGDYVASLRYASSGEVVTIPFTVE